MLLRRLASEHDAAPPKMASIQLLTLFALLTVVDWLSVRKCSVCNMHFSQFWGRGGHRPRFRHDEGMPLYWGLQHLWLLPNKGKTCLDCVYNAEYFFFYLIWKWYTSTHREKKAKIKLVDIHNDSIIHVYQSINQSMFISGTWPIKSREDRHKTFTIDIRI